MKKQLYFPDELCIINKIFILYTKNKKMKDEEENLSILEGIRMLSTIESVNNVVNNFIWGVPAMVCIVGATMDLGLMWNIAGHLTD